MVNRRMSPELGITRPGKRAHSSANQLFTEIKVFPPQNSMYKPIHRSSAVSRACSSADQLFTKIRVLPPRSLMYKSIRCSSAVSRACSSTDQLLTKIRVLPPRGSMYQPICHSSAVPVSGLASVELTTHKDTSSSEEVD